ncbi:MAG: hypothetical protein LBC56_00195 [Oscillospiraceae bacterium]|jgi:putative DNA primase/helicase|nr:hypothetical protein [Oscillospiraceae bacterium]
MNFKTPDIGHTQGFINPLASSENRARYSFDDRGNGYLFADMYKNECRYCPEAREWYRYDGKIWKPDPGALAARERAKELSLHMLKLAFDYSSSAKKDILMDNARNLAKNFGRTAMLSDASSVWPIHINDFDRNINLFNCQNGTLDLRTREFLTHNPEDMLSMISGVNYRPSTKCSRWNRFIQEIMEEDIRPDNDPVGYQFAELERDNVASTAADLSEFGNPL